jgi:hypothetical protein
MIFVAADCMCGVLIFATIVGNVGSMITAMGEARADFQSTVDSVRGFLRVFSTIFFLSFKDLFVCFSTFKERLIQKIQINYIF